MPVAVERDGSRADYMFLKEQAPQATRAEQGPASSTSGLAGGSQGGPGCPAGDSWGLGGGTRASLAAIGVQLMGVGSSSLLLGFSGWV